MRERLGRGRLGVVLAGAAVLIVAIVLIAGWAGKERVTVVSVAQPPALATVEVVPVRPDAEACLRGVTLVPDGAVALIKVGTRRKPGVPLTATVSGPGGYRAQASIPGTWQDNDVLEFRLRPPDRPLHGEFCVRNDGRHTVDLYGSAELRTIARTQVDGRDVGTNMQLELRTAEPRSVRDRVGDIAHAITLFRPGIVGRPVVWALVVLTLLALLVGAPWALWRALREPD